MLRLRLASLALASGLLVLLSGCASSSEGGMFPRLFRSNSAPMYGMPGECECQQGSFHGASQMPPIMDSASMPGPVWSSQSGPNAIPNAMPIPITNVPSNQPPAFPKSLQAQPTPFTPAH